MVHVEIVYAVDSLLHPADGAQVTAVLDKALQTRLAAGVAAVRKQKRQSLAGVVEPPA